MKLICSRNPDSYRERIKADFYFTNIKISVNQRLRESESVKSASKLK
jgi:hypothetical protein